MGCRGKKISNLLKTLICKYFTFSEKLWVSWSKKKCCKKKSIKNHVPIMGFWPFFQKKSYFRPEIFG